MTMKKLLCTFMAFAFIATALQAQSLIDNPYYRESVRLQEAATTAFEEGDYDAATDYAKQAQENAELSDEYVAEMLSMQAAENAVGRAQATYDWALGVRAQIRFETDFAMATIEMDAANATFASRLFDDAIAHAYMVESYLSGVTDEASFPAHAYMVESYLSGVTDEASFPASYMVQELSLNTDCLWRIAAKPFVYNDPLQWPVLYRANKALLPDPGNPDLLPPGLLLSIPSLSGELREGTWTEGVEYPTYNAK